MRFDVNSLIDAELWSLVPSSLAFYATRQAGHGARNFEELVAFRAALPVPAVCDPSPSTQLVTAGGRSVPVRIHGHANKPIQGAILEVHTGGFFMGSAAGSDRRNRALADALGVVVVSVDYRLSPEHPWPAAPDDCEAAGLWLAENSLDLFGTTRLAICGFSAGATLAMTTLLRLRDRGLDAFTCAVLQCGTYDLSAQTPAGRLIADEYFLDAYVGEVADRTAPDISPIYA